MWYLMTYLQWYHTQTIPLHPATGQISSTQKTVHHQREHKTETQHICQQHQQPPLHAHKISVRQYRSSTKTVATMLPRKGPILLQEYVQVGIHNTNTIHNFKQGYRPTPPASTPVITYRILQSTIAFRPWSQT